MKLNIHEIFDRVQKSPNPKEELLKLQNPLVTTILKLNYCLVEEFDLPEGAPPYNTNKMIPIGHSDTNLYAEMRRLYIFMKSKDLPKARKEQLFVNLLEGIHFTEAEILISVKDHNLRETFPVLTEELVNECFPNLIQKSVSDKVEVKENIDPKVLSKESSADSEVKETQNPAGASKDTLTKESSSEKPVILNANGKPKNRGGRPKGSPNKKKST
jgi:hypothetical protein